MLRARVLAGRRGLDEQLAAGVSPSGTPALALRARQLVSSGSRQQLASGLERLVDVDAAQRRLCPGAAGLPLARRELLDSRMALFGLLAARLRGARPVYAQGMASLRLLLGSGCRSVNSPYAGPALHDAIRAAADALDGHWPGGRRR
jgi:hypothetical protein